MTAVELEEAPAPVAPPPPASSTAKSSSSSSSSSSSLGPLPPIDAVPPPPHLAAAGAGGSKAARSAEEQAALEAELDALHEQLGVRRGHALEEAMKPKLEVPMPQPLAMAVPGVPSDAPKRTAAAMTAATRQPAAATAPTTTEQ